MALKSKEWFYKKCLNEVKEHGRFSHLCWDILEKGIGQSNSTRGHVTQAIGVSQTFLAAQKSLIPIIKAADPTRPFNVSHAVEVADALKAWLAKHNAKSFGKSTFGYGYKKFKNIVTPSLGGKLKGGGGGNDEFKRVLRLMAEFLS